VEKYVHPLVEAFGDEVVTGENLYQGPSVPEAVINRIESCDAMIGVASRYQRQENGYYSAYPWVQGELSAARAAKKVFVQLREQGLDPRMGILEGTQYIEYDSTNLVECIVKLAEALGEWHRQRNVPVYLVPADFAAAISPWVRNGGAKCQFRILDEKFEETMRGEAFIKRTPGGLIEAVLCGIPPGNYIELEVNCKGRRWTSDVQRIDSLPIIMTEAQ
jgi:hypothetical protein